MSSLNADQKYKVTFFPDEDLTEEEIVRGKKEAARQLHAIHEYPWPGLPSDIEIKSDYTNRWKTGEKGWAQLICDSYAHAMQVETFLGIVEGYNVDMEPHND